MAVQSAYHRSFNSFGGRKSKGYIKTKVEQCKKANSFEHLPNKQLLIMTTEELALKLRDYEIDRVVNKIMDWKPSCKKEGVRELLEYAHINIFTIYMSFMDDEENYINFTKGSLSYCKSIIEKSYDIKFNDEQSEWIAMQLTELLVNNIKTIK